MSLSRWNEGSDSDHMTGLSRDTWLVGYRKIPALQLAKLPRYWREGTVEVRPFTAKKKLWASEAQALSNEAMKGNPMTAVIHRVDESKSSPEQPKTRQNPKKRAQSKGKPVSSLGLCHLRLYSKYESFRLSEHVD